MAAPLRTVLKAMTLLAMTAAPTAAQSPDDRPISLALPNSRCQLVLPTHSTATKYLLVLGALSDVPGPHPVLLRTEPSDDPTPSIPEEPRRVPEDWQRKIHEERRRLDAARSGTAAPTIFPPARTPPSERVFYLFVKDQEFSDPEAYVAVTGKLAGVGRHARVYVDREHPDPASLQPTVEDIIRTFDHEVYPRACRELGHALDVDRDGRFTMLLTGRLGRLVNGGVSVSGFVRGSDFYRDTPPPFGNRCDMMYLNADLKPGPHLRTVLAHEYTHAVIFSEHVFGPRPAGVFENDEESWLNEALAHHIEKQRGYGWTNLDYRVSAFLNAPHRYGLVIPDYYRAGLWRSHGHRGATFLFLEACVQAHGPELISRLVQSPLMGVHNLEVASACRFEDLFRAWSIALVQAPPTGTLGERWLSGPRIETLSLSGARREFRLAGTGVAFFLLHSPSRQAARVTIEAAAAAGLQATLIPLPADTPRLELAYRNGRLHLTAHDGDVRLLGATWERLVPTKNDPTDIAAHSQDEAARYCRRWFGSELLSAGETRTSEGIEDLPAKLPNEGVIFRVSGIDARKRLITASALIGDDNAR